MQVVRPIMRFLSALTIASIPLALFAADGDHLEKTRNLTLEAAE